MQGLTTTLYEFKDHNIKEYHDDIYDFLEKKKLQNLEQLNLRQRTEKKEDKPISQNKLDFQANKEKEKELRKKRNRLKTIEQEIENTEKDIALMEENLNTTQDPSFFTNYQNKKELIENLMQEWEVLSMELEKQ